MTTLHCSPTMQCYQFVSFTNDSKIKAVSITKIQGYIRQNLVLLRYASVYCTHDMWFRGLTIAEVQSPSAKVRGYQRYNVRLKNTSVHRKLCNVDRLCLTHMFHIFLKKKLKVMF